MRFLDLIPSVPKARYSKVIDSGAERVDRVWFFTHGR